MLKEFHVIFLGVVTFYLVNLGCIGYIFQTNSPITADEINQKILCENCEANARAIEMYVKDEDTTHHPCHSKYLGRLDELTHVHKLLTAQKFCNFFFITYGKEIWERVKNRDTKFEHWLCYYLSSFCVNVSSLNINNKKEYIKQQELKRTLEDLKDNFF